MTLLLSCNVMLALVNAVSNFFENMVAGNYQRCQVKTFTEVLYDPRQRDRKDGSNSCDSNDDGCFSHIFSPLDFFQFVFIVELFIQYILYIVKKKNDGVKITSKKAG